LHSRSRQSCPPESPRLTCRWRSRVFRCLTDDRHSFSWMGAERPDEKWEKQENLWDAAQRLAQGNLPAYPSGASPADATSLRLVRDPRLNGTVTAVVPVLRLGHALALLAVYQQFRCERASRHAPENLKCDFLACPHMPLSDRLTIAQIMRRLRDQAFGLHNRPHPLHRLAEIRRRLWSAPSQSR